MNIFLSLQLSSFLTQTPKENSDFYLFTLTKKQNTNIAKDLQSVNTILSFSSQQHNDKFNKIVNEAQYYYQL